MPNKIALTNRQRLNWIDAVKGFAIFCVILGHCLQEYPTIIHIHNQYIQAFIMPLFMMISGYLSAKITGIAPIKKRAIQLLIPFTTWAIIAPLLNSSNHYGFSNFLLSVGKTFLYPDQGLWFLWTLFFICCIYSFANYFDTKLGGYKFLIVTNLICILCFPLFEADYFASHQIVRYYIIFSLGAVFKKNEDYLTKLPLLPVSWVIFLLFLQIFSLKNEESIFSSLPMAGMLLPTLVRFICNISGALGLFLLFKKNSRKENNGFIYSGLINLGKISLGIYFFHFFFVSIFTSIWSTYLQQPTAELNLYLSFFIKAAYFIFQIFATLAITVTIVKIAQRNRLLALLCLGTPFNR